MAKTFTVRKPQELRRAFRDIAKGTARPFKSTRRMFIQFGVQIDRDTMMTFRALGVQGGKYRDRGPWPAFNSGRGVGFYDTVRGSTTRTKKGTWKIRYGTDLKGVGSQGRFRPGARRYSMSSKLLQASGGFRSSFGIQKISNNRMIYGTNHKDAEEIMSNPARPVLWYTPMDRLRYTNMILKWWAKETRF